jgi:hypothetical protein
VNPPNTVLVAGIKAGRIPFAVAMVALYAAAIPIFLLALPDPSNLTIAVLLLFSGLFGGLATLADLLVSAEEAVRGDGQDPT